MEPTEHFGIYFGYIRRLFQSWVSPFNIGKWSTGKRCDGVAVVKKNVKTIMCQKGGTLPLKLSVLGQDSTGRGSTETTPLSQGDRVARAQRAGHRVGPVFFEDRNGSMHSVGPTCAPSAMEHIWSMRCKWRVSGSPFCSDLRNKIARATLLEPCYLMKNRSYWLLKCGS